MISQITSPENIKFTIEYPDSDKSVGNQLRNGVYESHIQNFIEKFVQPKHTCLDIGANFGQHTILMAKLCQNVHSVEAGKENYSYLVKNVEHNQLKNVQTYECGIWDKPCMMNFSYKQSNAACSFFSTEGLRQDDDEQIEVEMKTIDDLFLDLPRIDLIKIDIEGSELFGINGGTKTLQKHKPVLIVELNNYTSTNFMKINIMEVVDRLNRLGFVNMYTFQGFNRVGREGLNHYFNIQGNLLVDIIFEA